MPSDSSGLCRNKRELAFFHFAIVLPLNSLKLKPLKVTTVQVDLPKIESTKNTQATKKSLESFMPKSWLEGGIATLDASGRMLEVNEPLSNWLEKTPDGLIGQSFWDTMGELSADWKGLLDNLRASTSALLAAESEVARAATAPHPVVYAGSSPLPPISVYPPQFHASPALRIGGRYMGRAFA